MRDQLITFTEAMEEQLVKNDFKEHWNSRTQNYLNHQLRTVIEKLHEAVCSNDHNQVIRHSVNAANYSMMLSDNAKRLIKAKSNVR